jgi:hypothetical protein
LDASATKKMHNSPTDKRGGEAPYHQNAAGVGVGCGAVELARRGRVDPR